MKTRRRRTEGNPVEDDEMSVGSSASLAQARTDSDFDLEMAISTLDKMTIVEKEDDEVEIPK